MVLRILKDGTLQIDDVRICHRNFKGRKSEYNTNGDRGFSLVIPTQEDADRLIELGWNVHIKPAREEGEAPFMYLPVKVKFNARGPKVYVLSGNARVSLTESNVGDLDDLDIQSVNMDIRPYDWTMGGRAGRSAYLSCIEVVQNIDRFAARYAEEEAPEE